MKIYIKQFKYITKIIYIQLFDINYYMLKKFFNLKINGKKKAPTATTTFQYQNSTKIGHTIGLVGSIITFAYALFITISKLFKIDFTSSFHENFKFDLNSKMIILCFLSSLCKN